MANDIGDTEQAKDIRRLFEQAISVAAEHGPERDAVAILCHLTACWAGDMDLATTTLCVVEKSERQVH
jgi:hypothetical protein